MDYICWYICYLYDVYGWQSTLYGTWFWFGYYSISNNRTKIGGIAMKIKSIIIVVLMLALFGCIAWYFFEEGKVMGYNMCKTICDLELKNCANPLDMIFGNITI